MLYRNRKNKTKKYFQSGGVLNGQDFYGSISYVPTMPNIVSSEFYKYQVPQDSALAIPEMDKDMQKNMRGLKGEQNKVFTDYLTLRSNIASQIQQKGNLWATTLEGKQALNQLNNTIISANRLRRNQDAFDAAKTAAISNKTLNQNFLTKDGNALLLNQQTGEMVETDLNQVKPLLSSGKFKVFNTASEVAEYEDNNFNIKGDKDRMYTLDAADAYSQKEVVDDLFKKAEAVRGKTSSAYDVIDKNLKSINGILGISGRGEESSNNVDALNSLLDLGINPTLRAGKLENYEQVRQRIEQEKQQIQEYIPELKNIKDDKKRKEIVNTLYYSNKLENSNYWKNLDLKQKNAFTALAISNLGYGANRAELNANIAQIIAKQFNINLQVNNKYNEDFKPLTGTDGESLGAGQSGYVPTKPVDNVHAERQALRLDMNNGVINPNSQPLSFNIGEETVTIPNSSSGNWGELYNNIEEKDDSFKSSVKNSPRLNILFGPGTKFYSVNDKPLPENLIEKGFVETSKPFAFVPYTSVTLGEGDNAKVVSAYDYFTNMNGTGKKINQDYEQALKSKKSPELISQLEQKLSDAYRDFLQNPKPSNDIRLTFNSNTAIIVPVVTKITEEEFNELNKSGFIVEKIDPTDGTYETLMNTYVKKGATEAKDIEKNKQNLKSLLDNNKEMLVRIHVKRENGKDAQKDAYAANTPNNVMAGHSIDWETNQLFFNKKGLSKLPAIIQKKESGGTIFIDEEITPEKPKFVFRPITLVEIE